MRANDLNESHIGQRFRFEGVPVVEGELKAISVGDMAGELRFKIINATDDNDLWASGYYIDDDDVVIPLTEPEPKPSNIVRDKLAEYIQGQYREKTNDYLSPKRARVMADIFTELMEGGADAS